MKILTSLAFWFYVDQRPLRDRGEAIVASVSLPVPDVQFYVPLGVARLELLQLLERCRLIPGATSERVCSLVEASLREGDVERCRAMIARVVPVRGALLRWRVLSVVGVIMLVGAIAWRWWPREAVLGTLIALALFLLPFAYEAWPFVRIVLRSIRSREYWRSLVRCHQLVRAASANDGPLLLALYRTSRAVAMPPSARWSLVESLVFGMSAVAAWAAEAGDATVLGEVYEDARRLIAEDRVPIGTGYHLADVLELSVRGLPKGSPFPVDAADVLFQLRLRAPEAVFRFGAREDTILGWMRVHTSSMESRIRRWSRSDDPTEQERASDTYAHLRLLAHAAPGVVHARESHALAIDVLARKALDEGAADALHPLLNDIGALVERLESFEDPRSLTVDRAGPTLMTTLEQIAGSASDAPMIDRALVLLGRLARLFPGNQDIYRRTLEATGRAPKPG